MALENCSKNTICFTNLFICNDNVGNKIYFNLCALLRNFSPSFTLIIYFCKIRFAVGFISESRTC